MGFIAPIIIQGKLFLREVTSLNHGWDELLPERYSNRWTLWKKSLSELRKVNIPRMFAHVSLSQAKRVELHVFSDASKEAIDAVSYLKVFDINNVSKVCFLFGKAKVVPRHGHTIPRLELCVAVLAVEVSDLVSEHIDAPLGQSHFYTDSKIVLGYIHNEKWRFQVYVSNRVDRIRQLTHPSQWRYVSTDSNPADLGTRGINITEIESSLWMQGPSFLFKEIEHAQVEFPLIDADNDKEVSTISHSFKEKSDDCNGWHICNRHKTASLVLYKKQIFSLFRQFSINASPKKLYV